MSTDDADAGWTREHVDADGARISTPLNLAESPAWRAEYARTLPGGDLFARYEVAENGRLMACGTGMAQAIECADLFAHPRNGVFELRLFDAGSGVRTVFDPVSGAMRVEPPLAISDGWVCRMYVGDEATRRFEADPLAASFLFTEAPIERAIDERSGRETLAPGPTGGPTGAVFPEGDGPENYIRRTVQLVPVRYLAIRYQRPLAAAVGAVPLEDQ